MRTSSKGQVTIPARIHEPAGILPETKLEFHGEVVRIIRALDREGVIAAPVSSRTRADAAMSR